MKMKLSAMALVMLAHLVCSFCYAAQGIIENEQLERRLRKNEAAVLALFPAKGFSDGLAGYMRQHKLFVVPDSEQAWCQDVQRGRLASGCYVIFFLQIRGLPPKSSEGGLCGAPVRWFKAIGSKSYVPLPGWAFLALPISNGEIELVLYTIKDDTRRLCE